MRRLSPIEDGVLTELRADWRLIAATCGSLGAACVMLRQVGGLTQLCVEVVLGLTLLALIWYSLVFVVNGVAFLGAEALLQDTLRRVHGLQVTIWAGILAGSILLWRWQDTQHLEQVRRFRGRLRLGLTVEEVLDRIESGCTVHLRCEVPRAGQPPQVTWSRRETYLLRPGSRVANLPARIASSSITAGSHVIALDVVHESAVAGAEGVTTTILFGVSVGSGRVPMGLNTISFTDMAGSSMVSLPGDVGLR